MGVLISDPVMRKLTHLFNNRKAQPIAIRPCSGLTEKTVEQF